MKRVRANQSYRFEPFGMDIWDSRVQENVKPGDIVTVVALRGCPPPNTMGMCHIKGPDGKFGGLVLTASLQSLQKEAA